MSAREVHFTDVGEGLNEAEIVRWMIEPGGPVRRDQVVVEVETAKSIVDIPAPTDGTLLSRSVSAGDTVRVGEVLYVLDTLESHPMTRSDPQPCGDRAADRQPADRPAGPERPLAAPPIRKIAREHGIDLTTIAGSGPGGRITRADIEVASALPTAGRGTTHHGAAPDTTHLPAAPDTVEALRGTRRTIARAMARSWSTIPHITDIREIDATELVRTRRLIADAWQSEGLHLSYLPLLIMAVVHGLKRVPSFNASVDAAAETVTFHHGYHIGIATSTDQGLLVPVIRDADRYDLRGLTQAISTAVAAARAHRSTPTDLSGGTFTVTNYGTYGGWVATPIIRPPESAIVGVGRIDEKPAIHGGHVVARQTLPISVSADHRIIDGSDIAQFYDVITRLLTRPILLLDAGA